MFFQGSIQEGISAAVGQQKLLLCFVTDNNEESQDWENDFLPDESVNELIATKAITLRLEAGSDEAGYLAQIFPLPKAPTVVIMKHGELKEYIATGTTKSDFLRRVSRAFSGSTAASAPTATPVAATESVPDSNSAAASSPVPTENVRPDGSENVRRVLAERAAKLQREAAERQAKEAAAKGKGKATDASSAAAAPKTKAQKEAAELIRKKKAQESDERRRILKRIQDDKDARWEKAAERERRRQQDRAAEQAAAQTQQEDSTPVAQDEGQAGAVVAIQVRLPDGSTLRNRFGPTQTVGDVRAWVDSERSDGNGPYALKQVLAPRPSRTIDATEEHMSVYELGLAPSSTLLLIPIQRFATAYDGRGSSRDGGAGASGFLASIVALVAGFFTWFASLFGFGGRGGTQLADTQTQDQDQRQEQQQQQQPQPTANSPATSSGQRVRSFENPDDRRREQQLYNGNSLNFEPRPDEEEI